MNVLLDTHIWIWSQESPEKLGRKTNRLILNPKTTLYVSTISTLEIARLISIGTIQITGSLLSWITDTLDLLMGETVSISHEIATEAYKLPSGFHKDPADRILAATARIHELVLLTADDRILAYPHVRTEDARL